MISLTAEHFRDALDRHVDASKPDPLARGQIEGLRLGWEQQREDGDGGGGEDPAREGRRGPENEQDGGRPTRRSLRGTLTLSSEYVRIAIRVVCDCKIMGAAGGTRSNGAAEEAIAVRSTEEEHFENEFYFRLTATASLISAGEHDASAKDEKLDRKERAAGRKLRAGMIERLRSDKSIRRLLANEPDDDGEGNCAKDKVQKIGCDTTEGVPLCEALIQQNGMARHDNATTDRAARGELEERVDVCEDSLEGIRNALFGHCEDNLDVLELFLSMPYLPRASGGGTVGSEPSKIQKNFGKTLHALAERAYLRLILIQQSVSGLPSGLTGAAGIENACGTVGQRESDAGFMLKTRSVLAKVNFYVILAPIVLETYVMATADCYMSSAPIVLERRWRRTCPPRWSST